MWYSGTSQVSLIGFGGMDFTVLGDSLKAVSSDRCCYFYNDAITYTSDLLIMTIRRCIDKTVRRSLNLGFNQRKYRAENKPIIEFILLDIQQMTRKNIKYLDDWML